MTSGVRLSALLDPDLVLLDLGAGRKEDILLAMTSRMARRHPGVDQTRLMIALLKREQLMNTALADGIAIPHGRLRGLPNMIAALGRSRVGIDWGSQDGGPTHLFLVLAVPEDCPGRT